MRSQGSISSQAFNELLSESYTQTKKKNVSTNVPRKRVTIALADLDGVACDVAATNNIAAGVLLAAKIGDVVSKNNKTKLVKAFALWSASSQSSKNDECFNSAFEYIPSSSKATAIKEDIYEHEPESPPPYVSTPNRPGSVPASAKSSSSSPKKVESTPKKRKLDEEQAAASPDRGAAEASPSPFIARSTPNSIRFSSSIPRASSESVRKPDALIDNLSDKVNNIDISTSTDSRSNKVASTSEAVPCFSSESGAVKRLSLPLQSDFDALHESMVEATSAAIGHLLQQHRMRKDASRSDNKQLLDKEFRSMSSTTKKLFDFNTIAALGDKGVREKPFVPFGCQGIVHLPGGEQAPVKAGAYSFVPLCELPLLRDKIGSWREKYGKGDGLTDKENVPPPENFLRSTDFQHASLLE